MKQSVGSIRRIYNIQIQKAVVVVVRPGGSKGVSYIHRAALRGHIVKSAISIVAVQDSLNWRASVHPKGNIEIGVTVIIVVSPRPSLGIP